MVVSGCAGDLNSDEQLLLLTMPNDWGFFPDDDDALYARACSDVMS